jgi:arylsulfatase A-like enzyme
MSRARRSGITEGMSRPRGVLVVAAPLALTLAAMLEPWASSLASAAPSTPGPTTRDRTRPPNVLFIVADDLNTALGTYGHPLVETPHLDRLAARGVRFDRAYTQYPLCSPSRTSFLTGRRPNVTRILTNPGPQPGREGPGYLGPYAQHFRSVLPATVTLPQLFRAGGWFVTRVGKMYHYGVPADIGTGSLDDYASWDLAINPRGRDRDDEAHITTLARNAVGSGPRFGGVLSWLSADGRDDEQTDGIAATEAIRLLERHKRRKERFFLAVGFYRPHTPFVAPRRYFAKYPKDRVQPGSKDPREDAGTPGLAYASASTKPEQARMTEDERRSAVQAYYASITFMDAQVGRLLDALGRLGLEQETIVTFTSDHGYHLGEHGLWQKQSLFEQSARVPLIVAGPGVKARGKAAGAPVELLDLYPTLADLAGLTAPTYVEGKSLRPMLEDATATVKPAAFTQVMRSGGVHGLSVRTARWHYVAWQYGEAGRQLYDTAVDPGEVRNLAGDPAHAATLAELHALALANWPPGSWGDLDAPAGKAAKRP